MPSKETYERAFPEVAHPKPAYSSYGIPFTEACTRHVNETFQAERVYVIASGGLTRSSDALDRLKNGLGQKIVAVRIGVPQHTPFTAVVEIAQDVRATQADCIVTLGGGSISDAAKMVALVAANPDHMPNIFTLLDKNIKSLADITDTQRPGINSPTIPVICVPTSLSAGEYTRFSGCTDPETRVKWQFYDPKLNPDLVILDPKLTTTTPEWAWLSTGIRAIDHCVEALCNVTPRKAVDDACALSLGRLASGLLTTKSDPMDLDARLHCQLGARGCMIALNMGVMFGASHGIGHMLGPLGVGHGQTSCILLPFVMKYNSPVNADRQERVKEVLWSVPEVSDVLTARGLNKEMSDAGDLLDALFRELGLPRSLKEVGVTRDNFQKLADASLKDAYILSNPRPISSVEQVFEILEMAAGDQ